MEQPREGNWLSSQSTIHWPEEAVLGWAGFATPGPAQLQDPRGTWEWMSVLHLRRKKGGKSARFGSLSTIWTEERDSFSYSLLVFAHPHSTFKVWDGIHTKANTLKDKLAARRAPPSTQTTPYLHKPHEQTMGTSKANLWFSWLSGWVSQKAVSQVQSELDSTRRRFILKLCTFWGWLERHGHLDRELVFLVRAGLALDHPWDCVLQ